MDTISEAVGKDYLSPKTKEAYTILAAFDGSYPAEYSETENGKPIAEDGCGNLITTKENKAVYFWDHETDETTLIADSIEEIIEEAKDPEPVDFDESKVESSWIDPSFAKEMGIKTDEEGWIKKPKKSRWKFWKK